MDKRQIRHRGYRVACCYTCKPLDWQFFRLGPSHVEGLRKALSLLYTPDVVKLTADNSVPNFDKSKFDAAIDWIHSQKRYNAKMLEGEPALDLILETAHLFEDAFDQGIATAVIPPAMDAKLRESLFLFSACKTHQELTEAAALLRTDDGRVKPFEQFSGDVTRIHKDYNVNYLNAEYKFAVSSSQMAAKWAEVEVDGDRYNLQYRTADDASVRESHRALHNITLPPSDPFWDKYYPPNGWGCRCTAVQVRKSKYETSDPEKAMTDGLESTRQISNGVDKGAIFRFNPGKNRQIFPPKHPYYKMSALDAAQVKKVTETVISASNNPIVDINKYVTGKNVTEAAVKDIMHAYADKFKDNYNGGLIDVTVKRSSSAFMSNGRYRHHSGNILTLHNYNFAISKDVSFNPFKETRDAFDAIRSGKSLSFMQEYAMESIWHETLHAKAKGWKDRSLRNDRTVMHMETINQFIARNTYPQFIESFGGKATNHKQVIEQGYGYGNYITNFRELLKRHKIEESDMVNAISDKLLTEPYENIGSSTIKFLESKGVENAEKYMTFLGKNPSDYMKYFNQGQ